MLWKRLTDVEHVMHVQKALIVVEYLLRYGSERFINDAKRRSRDIAALQKYKVILIYTHTYTIRQ